MSKPIADSRQPAADTEETGGLLGLVIIACFLGAASGLLGAVFRLTLESSDRFRDAVVSWAHGYELGGLFLVVALTATATGLAAWYVRQFSPAAQGSGIPHVEAVLAGEQPPAPWALIPVKFFGGLLAMGAGLALGREGPSVQMGASLAHLLGTIFRRNKIDGMALLAAGAGSGLATAFNAPLAGAVFVLEELVRRFDTRITITTLCASASAIAVARLLLGQAPDFHVEPLPSPDLETVPLFLLLGLVMGLFGVAYNRTLLSTLAVATRLSWPVEVRAGLVGAGVGLVAWLAPDLVGGGDAITQRALAGGEALLSVALVLVVRFALGAVSYAAGTPGGLFAPLLVLGAQGGLLFGNLYCLCFPAVTASPQAFAIVGMAALFTAIVRAPVTGIVLITEMTHCFTLLLPMLLSCFVAMTVPTLMKTAPIYDSLRERTPRNRAEKG